MKYIAILCVFNVFFLSTNLVIHFFEASLFGILDLFCIVLNICIVMDYERRKK